MEILELVVPTVEYKAQVMDFKCEMLEYGSDFDGCAGLNEVDTYEEWLDFRGREEKKAWASPALSCAAGLPYKNEEPT